MSDEVLVREILEQILEATGKIQRRFQNIHSPDDFLNSDEGLDMLDSICMMLIATGESLKKVDRLTNGKLLSQHPEIDWKGIKGVRDVISHHYFDIDAEEIFLICKNDIILFSKTIQQIIDEL